MSERHQKAMMRQIEHDRVCDCGRDLGLHGIACPAHARNQVSKRPSVESLWQAFWATPHDDREWGRPTGTDGKPIPMTLISFKYEVVRAAFELDALRERQHDDLPPLVYSDMSG